MYAKILLGLFTAVLMMGDVSAQSGGRSNSGGSGSNARSYQSAAAQRKIERMQASEISRFARKIEKANFADIQLESTQKRALKEMVKTNYEGLAMVEQKMVSMIPAESASDLKRYYSAALRKGSSESEAMLSSMASVGFPEPLQEKIMMLGKESEAAMQEIANQFAGELSPEQKQILMASAKEAEMKEAAMKEAEMKEAEMEKAEMKEEMTDGDTEMTGDQSDRSQQSEDLVGN